MTFEQTRKKPTQSYKLACVFSLLLSIFRPAGDARCLNLRLNHTVCVERGDSKGRGLAASRLQRRWKQAAAGNPNSSRIVPGFAPSVSVLRDV